MNYPCLVPKRLCRTKIQVHLESEEITNMGKPKYTADLQFSGQGQDNSDCGKETGTDNRDSAVPRRHCAGYAVS